MTTSYYLHDQRCMTPEEMARAYAFDDTALICHKAIGKIEQGNRQMIYTLRIPLRLFSTLPPDLQLTNNNNDASIRTIQGLREQIRRRNGRIVTLEEAAVLDQAAYEQWLKSRPNTFQWNALVACVPSHLPVEPARVMDYLERLERKYAQN